MVESIQIIHQKGVKLRKYAEDLIIYLKERSLIEEAYAKDLERLALKLNQEFFPEFSEFFKKVTVQEAAAKPLRPRSRSWSKVPPNTRWMKATAR